VTPLPSPRSPPFPYTPLFRSVAGRAIQHSLEPQGERLGEGSEGGDHADPPHPPTGTDHGFGLGDVTQLVDGRHDPLEGLFADPRSEEHTSELQSRENLVCRLL